MSTECHVAGSKRERTQSHNALVDIQNSDVKKCNSDYKTLKANQDKRPAVEDPLSPVVQYRLGESKADYFARLKKKVDHSLFSAAYDFNRNGIYVYKRPVRTGSPQHLALLAQAGTVFHHVVIYLKQNDDLIALEYGPNNSMDITENFLMEAPPGPILQPSPEPPQKEHLPMLHIAAQHCPVDAPHVRAAIEFAEKKPYQALKNNCIAFADFMVRVLTQNGVRSAPLIFDPLVGRYPEVDSPLLPLLPIMAGVTWHDIADGSRLLREFVSLHGDKSWMLEAGHGLEFEHIHRVKQAEEDCGAAIHTPQNEELVHQHTSKRSECTKPIAGPALPLKREKKTKPFKTHQET